ncbi:ribonuclease H-like domain-containing protein [Tanacetum coccineum]
MCDGGEETCGVSKTGNLRFWYCNYDNERRNINGKGLSFPDFLLGKYGKSQTNALVWDNRYAEWCDISTKACDDAGKARMEIVPGKDYILLPLWTVDPPFSQSLKSSPDARFKPSGDDEKKVTEEPGKEGGDPSKEDERDDQEKDASVNTTNNVNAASINEVNAVGKKASIELPDEPNMPAWKILSIQRDQRILWEKLTFFLGLQVKQKEDGIFISQDKYVTEILKKFGFTDVKTASTPMETQKLLLKDEDGEEVDVHLY